MNAREMFLAQMAFEQDAPIPKWEYGYWAGAVRQWYEQGLPQRAGIPDDLQGGLSVRAEVMGEKPGGFVDRDIHDHFLFDTGFKRIPANNFMAPQFVPEVLEDHGEWMLCRNAFGIRVRQFKDRSSPEAFVESPVADFADWERIKAERFSLDLQSRLPGNWPSLVSEYERREYPLILGGGQGFYGSPRYLIGDERILYYLIEKPDLILAINEHLCELWIALYDHILDQVKPDMFLIWEDMCYRAGPLISPAMFEKFMLPYYRRLTAVLRDHGVRIVFVDTDGNFWKLIPQFLAGGVTGIFPVEAAAGMRVTEVRRTYPTLQLMGGVDKRELFKESAQIEAYLRAEIFPVLEHGGYVPTIDHLVPSQTPWESFSHYRKLLNERIDQINDKRSLT